MARFYRVARLDDGRPSSFRVEWVANAARTPLYFEIILTDGDAEVALDQDNQRLVMRLDAEELAALRRFLSEAERTAR